MLIIKLLKKTKMEIFSIDLYEDTEHLIITKSVALESISSKKLLGVRQS